MALTKKRRQSVVMVLLLSGTIVCASQEVASSTHPERSGGNDAASASLSATQQPSSQFALGAADVIHVNVWKNPDLSQSVTVGPDGFVSLPLIGDVHVAGMTANQLGQDLVHRLTTYLLNPQVTVSLTDIRSRQVFILGQVTKPGSYPIIAPTTVLQLIAQAGGLGIYANTKKISILRGGQSTSSKLNFNYTAVLHGDGKQDITLQPGDTVVVP